MFSKKNLKNLKLLLITLEVNLDKIHNIKKSKFAILDFNLGIFD